MEKSSLSEDHVVSPVVYLVKFELCSCDPFTVMLKKAYQQQQQQQL